MILKRKHRIFMGEARGRDTQRDTKHAVPRSLSASSIVTDLNAIEGVPVRSALDDRLKLFKLLDVELMSIAPRSPR